MRAPVDRAGQQRTTEHNRSSSPPDSRKLTRSALPEPVMFPRRDRDNFEIICESERWLATRAAAGLRSAWRPGRQGLREPRPQGVVSCLTSTAYCVLRIAYVVYCLLSVVCCLLSVVYCVLYVVYCLLAVGCCLLAAVVCCLLAVVYCLCYVVSWVLYIAYRLLYVACCISPIA